MIVTCPHCKKKLKAPDNAAGKRVRCPGCMEVIPVADTSGGSSPSASGIDSKPVTPTTGVVPTARRDSSPPSASTPRTAKSVAPKPASQSDSKPVSVKSGVVKPAAAAAAENTTRRSRAEASDAAMSGSADKPGSGAKASKESPSATSRKRSSRISSQPRKRKKPQETIDYDDNYEAGYDASSDDPWSSGTSWEEANPYAAPVYSPSASSSRNRNASGSGSLRIAGIGLLIQAWSYIGIIGLGFAMMAIAFIGAAAGMGQGPRQFGFVVGGLTVLAWIPLGLAILVGYVMCVFVPSKTQARIPMIIALASTVLNVLLAGFSAVGSAMNSPVLVIVFGVIRLVLWIVQIVAFCLFLKASAQYIGREDLAKSANIVMYGMTIGPVLIFAGLFMAGFLAGAVDPSAGIAAFIGVAVVGIGMLVVWVMQLFLMFRLGSALKNY